MNIAIQSDMLITYSIACTILQIAILYHRDAQQTLVPGVKRLSKDTVKLVCARTSRNLARANHAISTKNFEQTSLHRCRLIIQQRADDRQSDALCSFVRRRHRLFSSSHVLHS